MDKRICHCVHCGDEIKPEARINEQKYCGKDECQKARRATWQRQKMKKDAAGR